ncbi:UDP-N-acetylmuramate:L-alanyl-gamma-D-glutamyl-meso-diaminopimelate ligase [bacterium]|nr:UDP-N-acetylmuramate:L-alanyl-gamma-D-glutamyl-meso-diaminopimelate ligase [bacterium]
MKTGIKHIHLLGIGGTGMASLAGLLVKSGYKVSGSDLDIYPPMSDLLRNLKVKLFKGYDPKNLKKKPDLAIIGNVIRRDNPEAQAILTESIPYLSMPQTIANLFLKDKISIVIAGTHGKTTTSNLVAWILESAGLDPSFMIGGIGLNFNTNYKLGNGKYFVLEGDEYDTAFFDKGPKFLHYKPSSAILTSIEFDHADIYKDLNQINVSFKKFIDLIPESGNLIACADCQNVLALTPLALAKVSTYGINNESNLHIDSFDFHEKGTTFKVKINGAFHEFNSSLFGVHNLQNSLGAILLCIRLGLEIKSIKDGLASFKGVKRRQEILNSLNGRLVIDDFAHHPTAVKYTIEAIKSHFKGRTVWAIFEPRSNTSRRNIFQSQFAEALSPADKVIVAEVYKSDQLPKDEVLDVKRLIADIRKLGSNANYIKTADEIVNFTNNEAGPEDIFLVMSNGGFDNIHSKLINSHNSC